MTLALDDYQELLRKLDRLKRRRDQAKGALNEILKRLKKEFGCNTIQEAEAKLEELLTKEIETHKRYVKVKTRFEKKYAKVLKEI
jgi:uncharacterized protein with ATP-grasp and redox domains